MGLDNSETGLLQGINRSSNNYESTDVLSVYILPQFHGNQTFIICSNRQVVTNTCVVKAGLGEFYTVGFLQLAMLAKIHCDPF